MTISPTASAIKVAASLRSRLFLAGAGAALLIAAVPAQAEPMPSTDSFRFGIDCIDAPATGPCSPSAVVPGALSLTRSGNDVTGPTGDSGLPEEEPCVSCT